MRISLLAIFLVFGSLSISADDSQLAPGQIETYTPPTQDPVLDYGALNRNMEECRVVDAQGKGLIKPYMAQSGTNLAGDPEAWIWVPKGQCSLLNAGDFNGIAPEILDKID